MSEIVLMGLGFLAGVAVGCVGAMLIMAIIDSMQEERG